MIHAPTRSLPQTPDRVHYDVSQSGIFRGRRFASLETAARYGANHAIGEPWVIQELHIFGKLGQHAELIKRVGTIDHTGWITWHKERPCRKNK